ncbi:hypothetical protein AAA629_05715 [Pseudomonas aeruginosa]
MSSTQHQLIEQCATRLRGIVEALDNIHDTSPHRWSTDLDDVHSSAESLLAMIKGQAPTQAAQGLAGAALAQPSQSQYEASFEEWLANELEGEDGQPVPAAVCDIALARRAFNHWPKLEQPAKVGGVRFSAGVSSRLVVEAAQRLYEFESTPEKEAERIERLQAFREQLDPLNLAPHAEAFNEAPDEAIRPEQAEAERPEVVAFRYHCTNAEGEPLPGWFYSDDAGTLGLREPLMTVAQHERIVGALRAKAVQLREALEWRKENQAGQRELLRSVTAERDAALARVAELERQEPVALANRGLHAFWVKWTEAAAGLYGPGIKLYAAPVAQAQQLNDLDKQCRDDVARALGLRPNQERGFAWSYLLASIKSCVKASGDSAQAQHSGPEGWKLVPVEPTEDVLEAIHNGGYVGDDQELRWFYQSILAAAPAPGGE